MSLFVPEKERNVRGTLVRPLLADYRNFYKACPTKWLGNQDCIQWLCAVEVENGVDPEAALLSQVVRDFFTAEGRRLLVLFCFYYLYRYGVSAGVRYGVSAGRLFSSMVFQRVLKLYKST